jgi:hypothetical protein
MTWIVNTKGGPNRCFEIAVLKSDNEHGIRSYGWFGPDKIYISGSGGPCNDKVEPFVWDKLIEVAKATAERMNSN